MESRPGPDPNANPSPNPNPNFYSNLNLNPQPEPHTLLQPSAFTLTLTLSHIPIPIPDHDRDRDRDRDRDPGAHVAATEERQRKNTADHLAVISSEESRVRERLAPAALGLVYDPPAPCQRVELALVPFASRVSVEDLGEGLR